MSYLYAKRFSYNVTADPLVASIRSEIFPGCDYAEIDWPKHRHAVADIDNYSPVPWFVRQLQDVMAMCERLGPWKWLREQSLRYVAEYMQAEDIQTNYLTIGPVSKALHLLCAWIEAGGESDPATAVESDAFRAHVSRVPAYLWLAEDGMKVQGYNGSMVWDTSFAMQAAVEAGLEVEFPTACANACAWLAEQQVRVLPEGDWRYWRQPIRGGWGFSTAEQAWPVSDTTAEAFKAVLRLRGSGCTLGRRIPDQHLLDTANFLLSYQNADGGWATYENCRGYGWYEFFNPSEVFGNIMIDYSYVECTASAMAGLALFTESFPGHRTSEISGALVRGANFIKSMQRTDGSWYGCWGVCFTYGCWFAVEGLLSAGESTSTSPAIKRCIKFLLAHQNQDGGWAEDFASCYDRSYSPSSGDSSSGVVQTAWALLALMAADGSDHAAVQRGLQLLMRRQLPSGDWGQEGISGVFNRSVGITYTAFRNVFPIWALGRYSQGYSRRHNLPETWL
jgi:squalene/oxidosqualene cyclase-like protein